MLRFVTSCGTAQLLFLCSALCEQKKNGVVSQTTDILLLSGNDLPNERREAMLAMAKAAWKWHEIIMVDYYLRPNNENGKVSTQGVAKLLKSFDQPDELWFCMPYEIEEKTLMMLYPNAKLHLCEDGLGTYTDMYIWSELIRHPRRLIKYMTSNILRHSSFMRSLAPSLSRRYPARPLACSHLFLIPRIPVPSHLKKMPCEEVSADSMLLVINGIRDALPQLKIECGGGDKKSVLFMGQYFCGTDSDIYDKEYAIYSRAMRYYYDNGYEVWWKEHPKARLPFGDKLEKEYKDINIFSSNRNYPIEVLIKSGMFTESVGILTTSLFTLEKLYNVLPQSLFDWVDFPVPKAMYYFNQFIDNDIKI